MSEEASTARGVERPRGAPSEPLGPAASALPLRLSVGRAGLSIELTAAQDVGPAVVLEELSLGLESLSYPLDLSKGVKQFRNRRTRLDECALSVRLPALIASLGELPYGLERLTVKLRHEEPRSRAAPSRDAVVGIVALGERVALSFDLVLTFGRKPRFVLDEVTGLGLPCSPLVAALSLVDVLAERVREVTGEALLLREGRSCEVLGLPRAALLRVLPDFGLRLPKTEGCVLVGLDVDAGELRFRYARSDATEGVGRRGLRLAGLAEHLRTADELLARGELAEARAAYLSAAEQAPREVSCLLALGHLDASFEERWESALSYFEEARVVLGDERSSSVELALAEHLGRGGRPPLAVEHYRVAARAVDPSIAGLALLAARELEPDVDERRRLLDEAIRRAPTLPVLSLERFRQALLEGDVGLATLDAERFLASARDEFETARLSSLLGHEYVARGFFERAIPHLQRALRVDPTSVEVRLALARALRERGEEARAVPLLVELAKDLEAGDARRLEARSVEATLADVRFQLAHLYGRVFDERSLAVAELRRIESRGEIGAAARLLEAELLFELGDGEGRLRAHLRLLEASEIGALSLGVAAPALLSAARLELERGDPALAGRLLAFLRDREVALGHLRPSPLGELARLERLFLPRDVGAGPAENG